MSDTSDTNEAMEYVAVLFCGACKRPIYGARGYRVFRGSIEMPVHVECMTEQHPN